MIKIEDIVSFLEEMAPLSLAEPWDNCGLLVDSGETQTSAAVVALDITRDVVDLAIREGAKLIVSHHPVIFQPMKRLSYNDIPFLLARHGISAVCMHTNLDAAKGGVGEYLTNRLEIQNCRILCEPERAGFLGETSREYTAEEFIHFVKEKIGCPMLRAHAAKRKISLAAVVNGAGGSYFDLACAMGADAFISGDIKHSVFVDAQNRGVTLIDAGHFETENIYIGELCRLISERFPDLRTINISKEMQIVRYF